MDIFKIEEYFVHSGKEDDDGVKFVVLTNTKDGKPAYFRKITTMSTIGIVAGQMPVSGPREQELPIPDATNLEEALAMSDKIIADIVAKQKANAAQSKIITAQSTDVAAIADAAGKLVMP